MPWLSRGKMNKAVKELVIARIEAQMPAHLRLVIGENTPLSKEEIIEHVKKEDKIGKDMIRVQLSFLKALTSGELVRKTNEIRGWKSSTYPGHISLSLHI